MCSSLFLAPCLRSSLVCLYSDAVRCCTPCSRHPLVHDALATLRDATTSPEMFRRMAVRISLLLATEATRDIPTA